MEELRKRAGLELFPRNMSNDSALNDDKSTRNFKEKNTTSYKHHPEDNNQNGFASKKAKKHKELEREDPLLLFKNRKSKR